MTSIRKQKFAEAYLQCRNAAEAARAAGYSPKSAARIGSKLLKDKEVKRAVKQAQEHSRKAAAWNLDRAVEELEANMQLARNCEKPDSVNKGIELICKLNGLFPAEKQEITMESEARHVLEFKEFKKENARKEKN